MAWNDLDRHVACKFAVERGNLHIALVDGSVVMTRYSKQYELGADTVYCCKRFAVADAGF